MFQDAIAWIINDNEGVVPPAFIAAKAGYDVWLGNSRGTQFTSIHRERARESRWDFSWEEMGRYDLTAVVKMIH